MNSIVTTDYGSSLASWATDELAKYGIVVLPNLITSHQLSAMCSAFETVLKRLRWNNYDGYEKTEPYRHMVEDILTLDQTFLDIALHPLVKDILNRYLGERFELVEAKGWKSLPTKRDFHGWHGDAWYDQENSNEIPREVKLAVYLTDVKTGAFNYIRGSHRKQHPRMIRSSELPETTASQVIQLMGSRGTAFLFDTSGIHRQEVPILEERQAIFYNYHDPDVRLQKEDIEFYRYHPLLLNAAFLGQLSTEDQRILGFGNQANFIPAYHDPREPGFFPKVLSLTHDAHLRMREFTDRVVRRFQRFVS